MNKKILVSDLLKKLPSKAEIYGNMEGAFFENAKPIQEANEFSIAFIAEGRADKILLAETTKAKVIFCDEGLKEFAAQHPEKIFVVVEKPKEVYASLVNQYFVSLPKPGIHQTAFVERSASIGKNVYIGPFTYVGNCKIGDNTVIYGNSHIYDNTTIGANVIIHAGTVIGADGFGYFKNENSELENFPHLGGVIIEDNVHIGANTCIDRGALGFTKIRNGAKIDNLVHIAHNVIVGENAMVIADAMVGGSTSIGDNSWIAPSSVLRDAISIGNNAIVGMGAVVTKNIPDDETWTGNPARPLSEFVTLNSKFKQLIKE